MNDTITKVNGFAKGEYPDLLINLKPQEESDYQVKYTDVAMGIESPAIKAGGILVSLWINVASIPCSVFSEEGLKAEDEAGALPLEISDETDEYGFPIRRWKPCRDTFGTVAINYRFYPRVVPPDYKFRPYYDFRNEHLGATGSGVSSLVVPENKKYHIHIEWDLSEMPADATAVSVKGEGSYDYVGIPEDYQFTMYAVGKVKCHATAGGRFKVYWLNEPLPDKERILDSIPKILQGMCDFFRDEDTYYRVFFRKDPFKMSNGATAFENGFIYGYSDEKPLNRDMALDIFSHEVVHTWPHIEDTHGEGTWYHEGTAEMYSIKIPYRLGITDLDDVARVLGYRGQSYYCNKYKNKPCTEVFPLYWSERDAQSLPYGRGFFYFIDTDAKIRKASGGKRSVDDLVLEIEMRRRSGKNVTCADWEELIEKELGPEAVTDFREIMNGKLIEPSEDWFDGAFTISKGTVTDPVRNRVETDAYIWTRRPDRDKADI